MFTYRYFKSSPTPWEYLIACGFISNKKGEGFFGKLNYYSVVWLLDGEGIYTGEDGSKTPLKRGSVIQRFPDKYHETVATNDKWREFYIALGKEFTHSLINLNVINEKDVFKCNILKATEEVFLNYYNELTSADDDMLSDLLLEAVSLIHKFAIDNVSADNKRSVLDIAVEILANDKKAELSIPELAKKINMGYSNFRQSFKIYKGTSPQEYRNNKRMNYAAVLAGDSQMSAKQISDELGFYDEFAFMKCFKKYFKETFGEYRKKAIASNGIDNN